MASNFPPKSGIQVPADTLRNFTSSLFKAAGTTHEHADLLGSMLVETDLRGVWSHGTMAAARYAGQMLDGQVNPRPKVRTVRSVNMTSVVDGDGGLGHLPCFHGMQWAIEEASKNSIAAFTTRNHAHIGEVGTYTRMALPHGLIGLAISSRRIRLDPEKSVLSANSGSPISIAVPADRQPPLVMDMGVDMPADRRLVEGHRQLYLRGLALGAVLQALGGVLAGVYRRELRQPDSEWESDQGAFMLVVDVASFLPLSEFKSEMDRFIGDARKMQPLPELNRTDLAGGVEWDRTEEYARDGIPISDEHRQSLEEIATRLSLETPFSAYEQTRFDAAVSRKRPRGASLWTTLRRIVGKTSVSRQR